MTHLFEWLRKLLTPPKAFSWQTLILLSLFSCILSFFATDTVQNILATFGWIFLIWGVAWGTSEKPFYINDVCLSPWITGALVCVFIFGGWSDGRPSLSLIWWPSVSGVIATIPEFIEKGLKIRIPPLASRQKIIVLWTSHFLVSCWIQFYFVVQTWLNQYPSLLIDNVTPSAFVVKVGSQPPRSPRGALILNLMEPQLLTQLDNQPWSYIERWLLNQQQQIEDTRKLVQKELPQAEEDLWWRFDSKILSSQSGYNLQLLAFWQGPRSKEEVYVIEKLCQINQVDLEAENPASDPSTSIVGTFKCSPAGSIRWVNSNKSDLTP